MEFYLKEAFKSLKLLDNERLDEEDFNLTADQGVIDELQSFVADDIEAPAEEEIIDVEADKVEDLQDNYVGKVILECDCCHTRIYKDIADVIIDEETGLANVEEECPVCSNAFGWNVIGKIEPFKEGEFDNKETEEEVEIEEVPEDDQELSDEEIGEALKEALKENRCEEECEDCDESCEDKKVDEDFEDPNKVGVDPDRAVEDDEKLEEPMENPVVEDPAIALAEDLSEDVEEVQSEDAKKLIDPEEEPVKEINEGIENLSLDTEDTHMEMTSDDDGKVTVVTEPIHEDEEVVTDEVEDEMIAPLDPEEISQIDNNEEQSAEEVAAEETEEEQADEAEEDELDIDEFDEESFDEMGESYLHRVYENVDSFKTSKVSYNDGKLVVEGLIKFKSGKEKTTSFVFENLTTTKRGKIISEGMNETFSKSKRAFILRGSLVNGKFIGESLTYNYNVKQLNESNESEVVRVYGRAITKK